METAYGSDVDFQLTPLHEAVDTGDLELVDRLIRAGANVEEICNYWTPLHLASYKGHIDIIQILLFYGARVNSKTQYGGSTPLHMTSLCAYNGGNIDQVIKIVEVLIQAGADIEAKDKSQCTPLHIFAFIGEDKIVKRLLECGADVRSVDHLGWTPLHIASYKCHLKTVEVLLSHGAPNIKSNYGLTPLHTALSFKQINKYIRTEENEEERDKNKVLTLLINAGANVNETDQNGNTALHIACTMGDEDSVKVLVKHKADKSVANKDNLTPLDVTSHRDTEIINLLNRSKKVKKIKKVKLWKC